MRVILEPSRRDVKWNEEAGRRQAGSEDHADSNRVGDPRLIHPYHKVFHRLPGTEHSQ